MLAPAHVGHLAMLRYADSSVRGGGEFRVEPGRRTLRKSLDFFDKLKRALSHGYFVEEDAKTGRMDSVCGTGLRVLARRPA